MLTPSTGSLDLPRPLPFRKIAFTLKTNKQIIIIKKANKKTKELNWIISEFLFRSKMY